MQISTLPSPLPSREGKSLDRLLPIGLLLIFLITSGLGCKFTPKSVKEATRPITLEWWRVFDDGDSVAGILEDYHKLHPNVSILYRKLRPEEFERELLDALAEDRGPDIFSIHNTSLPQWQSKLLPLPRELTVPYLVTKGKIKKETVVELRKERTLRLDQLKNQYTDVVAKDVVLRHQTQSGALEERIFGLPLAIDTLVLYSNRDLLNASGIPEPAKSWESFLDHVKKLTKIDPQGNIIQAGAAIGTADNIERATDILSVLMMQNGTVMMTDGAVSFAQVPPGLERPEPPGLEAARFYTDFADSAKEAYTWNATMPNSFDAFVNGTVAYFFGYSYHLSLIRSRAPRLNLAVNKLPQIDPAREVNFANYWIESVSAKTKHANEVWDFVSFATRAPNVKKYLEVTGKPTALRSLIPEQLEKEELSVLASQILTAQSWYRGRNWQSAEDALKEMINTIGRSETPVEILNITAGRVAQTIR